MQPTSTNQISGSTNQYQPVVIKRGSFTITLSTSDSTGVQGSTTVSLGTVKGTVLFPNVDIYRDATSGVAIYRKCPYAVNDTSGNLTETVYYDVEYDNPTGSIDVVVTMYSRTLSLNTVKTFYYVVYSTAIAPSAQDTQSIANFNYN